MCNSVKDVAEEGRKSQNRAYDIMNFVIEALNKELEREDITEEQRSEILELMSGIIDEAANKDTEFKKWTFGLTAIGLGVGVGTVAMVKSPALRNNTVKLLKNVKPF